MNAADGAKAYLEPDHITPEACIFDELTKADIKPEKNIEKIHEQWFTKHLPAVMGICPYLSIQSDMMAVCWATRLSGSTSSPARWITSHEPTEQRHKAGQSVLNLNGTHIHATDLSRGDCCSRLDSIYVYMGAPSSVIGMKKGHWNERLSEDIGIEQLREPFWHTWIRFTDASFTLHGRIFYH